MFHWKAHQSIKTEKNHPWFTLGRIFQAWLGHQPDICPRLFDLLCFPPPLTEVYLIDPARPLLPSHSKNQSQLLEDSGSWCGWLVMSIPGDGRNGPGEGAAPGREACQLGSGSETLRHGGTGRNSQCCQCRNHALLPFISLLLAEQKSKLHLVGVPQEPASSSWC